MNKIYKLATILFLALSLVNCSNDDDAPSGTLFVNNENFIIGTNVAPSALHNNTTFMPGGTDAEDYNTRGFFITNGDATTEANAKVVSVIIRYPTGQASINGTYGIVDINEANPGAFVACSFSDSTGEFGGDPDTTTGTITVTDNGNNNFKLVFNNIVLKDIEGGTATKTITGYCQTGFYSF